jgi:hypothetical protein
MKVGTSCTTRLHGAQQHEMEKSEECGVGQR